MVSNGGALWSAMERICILCHARTTVAQVWSATVELSRVLSAFEGSGGGPGPVDPDLVRMGHSILAGQVPARWAAAPAGPAGRCSLTSWARHLKRRRDQVSPSLFRSLLSLPPPPLLHSSPPGGQVSHTHAHTSLSLSPTGPHSGVSLTHSLAHLSSY